jgi:hypothetical protein
LLLDGPDDAFAEGLADREKQARIKTFCRCAAYLDDEAIKLGFRFHADPWTIPNQFRPNRFGLIPEIRQMPESWRQELESYVPEALA